MEENEEEKKLFERTSTSLNAFQKGFRDRYEIYHQIRQSGRSAEETAVMFIMHGMSLTICEKYEKHFQLVMKNNGKDLK